MVGRPASASTRKGQRIFEPNFPIGRFLSQALTSQCKDMSELRRFLLSCRYLTDKEQFGKDDYWLPPEQFEATRKGDCEDFALWVWRQLIGMGYRARFVVGRSGRYGDSHSWVTFEDNGNWFLLEAQAAPVGLRLPRLSAIRYQPTGSVEWVDGHARYFAHKEPDMDLPTFKFLALGFEWVVFWGLIVARIALAILLLPFFVVRWLIRRGKLGA